MNQAMRLPPANGSLNLFLISIAGTSPLPEDMLQDQNTAGQAP